MNNFNPDQNPHILSNPEIVGGNGGFGGSNLNEGGEGRAETNGKRGKRGRGRRAANRESWAAKNSPTSIPVAEAIPKPAVEDLPEALAEDGDNGQLVEAIQESGLEGGEKRADAGEGEDLEELPSLDGAYNDTEKTAEDKGEDLDQELPPLEDEPNFPIDSETGLSTALTTIESLKAQIQALEERGTRYQEIKSQIETERATEKTNLEESLQENETKLNKLYANIFIRVKAKGKFMGSEAQKSALDEYLESNQNHNAVSPIKAKFDACKKQIQELTATLATFDTDTESKIQTQVQAEKGTLQESLSEAQKEYSGSEAESNDKKVLLEKQLQEKLTDPRQLFSNDNIASIFAIYGLKEGLKKLEELKQESDQAREQAARDEIRKDIISHADLYKQIPELAEALSTDIQTKLEALQQSNQESNTINRALSLQGADRLDYLVNSKDPQLQELAFWFYQYRQDRSDSNILDEHPQFAQYVEKTTNQRYKQQQQEIKSGRIDGQQYLGSGRDNARRVEINERISRQFEIAKAEQISTLVQENGTLSRTKYDLEYAERELSALESKTNQAESDTTAFNTEISSRLVEGKIKFEGDRDKFSPVENSDILDKNKKIAQESEQVKQSIRQLIINTDGVPADIKAILTQEQDPRQISDKIQSQIDTIKNRKRYKWTFGLWGGGKIQALTQLQNSLQGDITKYSNLESNRLENQAQYEANNQSGDELTQLYRALPDRIKKSLAQLENPNRDMIIQTVNQELQKMQYELTEAKSLSAERAPQIKALQEQIVTLEDKIDKIRSLELAE